MPGIITYYFYLYLTWQNTILTTKHVLLVYFFRKKFCFTWLYNIRGLGLSSRHVRISCNEHNQSTVSTDTQILRWLDWTYFIVNTNTNGLDTSSDNLTFLSRTIRFMVVRLVTLYAYAWSFHNNISNLHSYTYENK